MTAPEIWGPRLWRLLHTLADLSDRRDVYPLWNSFLRATISNIPCQRCQQHMAEYWQRNRFLPKGWEYMRGEDVRQDIRSKLHAFHNNVNARLGKPQPPLGSLGTLDRPALYNQLREDYDFLKSTWPTIHMEWKQTALLLVNLVHGGSY